MQRILTTGSCYWRNKAVNALVEGMYECKGDVSCESRFPRPYSHSSPMWQQSCHCDSWSLFKNPNHILGPGIIKEKNPLARMKEFFAQLSTLWCIPLLDFMIGMFILLMIWGIIRDWGLRF